MRISDWSSDVCSSDLGAYQEILGDIHNLFGDTDAIEVSIDGDGYAIVQQRRGDTTDVMLDYVGYHVDDLRRTYRDKVAAAQMPAADAPPLNDAMEAGLPAYHYLADHAPAEGRAAQLTRPGYHAD